MTLLNNETFSVNGDVSLKTLKEIIKAVEKFAKTLYPGYQVGITEMCSDSSALLGSGDRTDIWLIANKIKGNVITDSKTQKVFFIDGKLLTCNQYQKLLEKEGVL